ncbi:DUF6480 family protein [Streptomyces sp. HNM0645]|uniref:DUF6480 family protein n=1 Tax=Streptomyces sp. HNM0645 TaxID=2782343 RepID=UPI0024B71573|nr:DUF6480 family protein [Streptomyces sp. HNM0645]MDI9884392.1 DUF6480 family protein [Streptomyces sp. HNM0645]
MPEGRHGTDPGPGTGVCIRSEDVDEVVQALRDGGAEIVPAPEDWLVKADRAMRTPTGDRPFSTSTAPRSMSPVRRVGWAQVALVAVCAIVLLVAAFFLAYALVLML